MSVHRYAARRDANESEIIEVLEGIGASVVQLSAKGLPDLLIGWRGETFLAETKSQRGKLTEAQKKFIEAWQGKPILIIRSVDDALQGIGAIS